MKILKPYRQLFPILLFTFLSFFKVSSLPAETILPRSAAIFDEASAFNLGSVKEFFSNTVRPEAGFWLQLQTNDVVFRLGGVLPLNPNVAIAGRIKVAPQDFGKMGAIYAAITLQNTLFVQNKAGMWERFITSESLSDFLTRLKVPQPLQAQYDVDITNIDFETGPFTLSLAYVTEGKLYFAGTELNFVKGVNQLNINQFTVNPLQQEPAQLNLTSNLLNVGNIPSLSTHVRFYQSTDAVISAADTELCNLAVPSIALKASYALNCVVNTPLKAGVNYYGLCLEGINNALSNAPQCTLAKAFNVTLPNLPDLAFNSLVAFPASVYLGDPVSLRVNLGNTGKALASDTQLLYYQRASNSNSYDKVEKGDLLLCQRHLYRLPTENSTSEQCDIKAPLLAGSYTYGVCVVAVTGEVNLTNNCSNLATLMVTEPPTVTEDPDSYTNFNSGP